MTERADRMMHPSHDWLDLSDAELRARLVQRGMDEDGARVLVMQRDTLHGEREIAKTLSAGA